MRKILIRLLVLSAIVATTYPVALGIAILLFDTGCLLNLCGLEALVYGGLMIWVLLIVVCVTVWAWSVRRNRKARH